MCYVYGSKYAAVELIDGLRSSENISQRLQVVLLVVSFILIMCPDVFRPSAETAAFTPVQPKVETQNFASHKQEFVK